MKIIYSMAAVIWAVLILSGCSVEKESTDKIREVDYTVVREEDIPDEFHERVKKAVKEPMNMTFADQGYLYVAKGYGAQDSSGYSISVDEFYETDNVLKIITTLQGPGEDEEIAWKTTCPFVVVKTEYIEKNVVFE